MSLVNQAVIIATAKTLMNRTWAQDGVLRQPVDPIDEVLRAAEGNQKPIIAVFIENSSFTGEGRMTQGTSNEIELKIFGYIAPGLTQLPDGVEFTLDSSTAGLTLDILARQVDAALHYGSARWLAIWKKFVYQVSRRRIRYMLIEIENGVKVPTIEICYDCKTIPDPDFVTEKTLAWKMLDEELRLGGAEGIKLADLISSFMLDPDTMPDYLAFQANYGLTTAQLQATGMYPYDIASVDDDGNTPGLENFDATGDMEVVDGTGSG